MSIITQTCMPNGLTGHKIRSGLGSMRASCACDYTELGQLTEVVKNSTVVEEYAYDD